MESLPLEIIYKILLNLSYSDILNYCGVNTHSTHLYIDVYFWMMKLDKDFIINGDLRPSEYIKSYNPNMGNNVYKRWYEAKQLGYRKVGNPYISEDQCVAIYKEKQLGQYKMKDLDILLWLMDSEKYDTWHGVQENYIDQLLNFALFNKDFNLLHKLEYKIPKKYVFKNYRAHGTNSFDTNILKWLDKMCKYLGADTGSITRVNGHLRILDLVKSGKLMQT